MRFHGGINGLGLPCGMVVAVDGEVFLIQHDKVAAVAANGEACTLVDITVQRFSSALALFNGVDDKFRPVVYVAADEDVLLRRLIGHGVHLGGAVGVEGHGGAGQPERHAGHPGGPYHGRGI